MYVRKRRPTHRRLKGNSKGGRKSLMRFCNQRLAPFEFLFPLSVSDRQPSGRGIGAILGPCIKGNHRVRGSLVDGVDNGFE
jgi:hypothetical protein